jgi:hypothetical protein
LRRKAVEMKYTCLKEKQKGIKTSPNPSFFQREEQLYPLLAKGREGGFKRLFSGNNLLEKE